MNDLYLRDLADGVVKDAVLSSVKPKYAELMTSGEDLVIGQTYNGTFIENLWDEIHGKTESKSSVLRMLNEAESVLKEDKVTDEPSYLLGINDSRVVSEYHSWLKRKGISADPETLTKFIKSSEYVDDYGPDDIKRLYDSMDNGWL